VVQLSLEVRFELVETLLKFAKCIFFHLTLFVVLFKVGAHVVEVFKLLVLEDSFHLLKDWSVFGLQCHLVLSKLLLLVDQALVLLLNLLYKTLDKVSQLTF